jgi:phosphohistidine phosphatase SixA
VRARQTGEAVAEAQAAGVRVEETEALCPGCPAGPVLSALRRPRRECVLLVGHEPDMGRLGAILQGLPAERGFSYSRGAIARIDLDDIPPHEPGTLVFFLTARIAGALAG